MSTALEDLLVRHVETGTIQGAVALLGCGDDVEVAAIGAASDDGRPMRADAIMRIQKSSPCALLRGSSGRWDDPELDSEGDLVVTDLVLDADANARDAGAGAMATARPAPTRSRTALQPPRAACAPRLSCRSALPPPG